MSSIGICEYCKHIDKDITERPCLHCSVNMGAFEFDLSEHDAKVRTEAIDKFADLVIECGMSNGYVDAESFIELAEQLKEKSDEN